MSLKIYSLTKIILPAPPPRIIEGSPRGRFIVIFFPTEMGKNFKKFGES
jgi:hypothetical protein